MAKQDDFSWKDFWEVVKVGAAIMGMVAAFAVNMIDTEKRDAPVIKDPEPKLPEIVPKDEMQIIGREIKKETSQSLYLFLDLIFILLEIIFDTIYKREGITEY